MDNQSRFSFTKAALDSVPLPTIAGSRITYHDMHRNASGLQLRVTANGVKTFCIMKRIKGGHPERITIGRYPDFTIEQARREAARLSVIIADGANPADAKRALRGEPTFSELFAQYIERHAKPNKKTWQEDQQRFNQYLSHPLGQVRLSAVDRRMIAAVHSQITLAGHPTVANRILALASSIFGWGINAGVCEANPAQGIKRNKEASRDRFLQKDELPRFFAALAEEPNDTIRDFFLICLLTGARRANVLSMHFKDINFDRAEWRLEETKNGTPQTVTLSPEVLEILKNRIPPADPGYVFPGTGATGHLAEPRKGWERILERAGLENLRPHDLRRTLGSWMAINGASLSIIGKSLNHKNVATTVIYARLDLDPVRESVNAATSAMLNAGKVSQQE